MALIAMCMPILPGKKDKWQEMVNRFMQEPLLSKLKASREDAGVHERTFLQETPGGDMIIITLEGDDLEGAMGKLMSDPDLREFQAMAAEVHGLDPDTPPPAPPKLVFDSRA